MGWEAEVRRPVFAAIVMAAATCFASQVRYELAMDLSMGGEHVGSPRLLLDEGVKSGVQINDTFIDVVAQDAPKLHGILMSFSIGKVEAGTRTVLATPAIVAAPGQRAEVRVTLDEKDPATPLTLVVTAQPR